MKLGKLVADWRTMNRYGTREVAKEIGISHATLSRIESGKPCDSGSMLKLITWMMKD